MRTSTPLTAIFDYQRTVIEQTQNAALETVSTQQTAVQQLAGGLKTGKQLQTYGNELKRLTLHASVDAIEQAAPAADLTAYHELVDDGIDALEQGYEQNWEAVIEHIEQVGDAADSYGETVDDSFKSFLETQAQVEDNTATVAEQIESVVPDGEVAAD